MHRRLRGMLSVLRALLDWGFATRGLASLSVRSQHPNGGSGGPIEPLCLDDLAVKSISQLEGHCSRWSHNRSVDVSDGAHLQSASGLTVDPVSAPARAIWCTPA